MASISDEIEQYILSSIGEEGSLCLSRNGLASFFHVSPSQINYVLTTRFSLDRGYLVESRRGGGGYLTVIRLSGGHDDYIRELLESEIGPGISYLRAGNILRRLERDGLLSEREMDLVLCCMNDKALTSPEPAKDRTRAEILKSVLRYLLKRGEAAFGE